jgi:CAAX prenyl protease-like protein
MQNPVPRPTAPKGRGENLEQTISISMKQHLPLIAFVTPYILFFAIPSLITYESTEVNDAGDAETVILPARYTAMIAARVILMAIVIGVFCRFYFRSFPFRIDHWGFITGILGAVLWIGLCHLQMESAFIKLIGLPEELLGIRDGVNPFETYPDAGERLVFLGFRFALLAIMVPIAEELFLRGFFMRVMDAVEWQTLPLKEIGTSGLVAGTLYGMATHPSEFVAAAVWFSLVTLLMVKTNKFWNCVVAHAVTNLILGVYVMATGTWNLW